MQELNMVEVDEVSGGWVPLAALLLACIVNSDKLSEFAEGVVEGFNR